MRASSASGARVSFRPPSPPAFPTPAPPPPSARLGWGCERTGPPYLSSALAWHKVSWSGPLASSAFGALGLPPRPPAAARRRPPQRGDQGLLSIVL